MSCSPWRLSRGCTLRKHLLLARCKDAQYDSTHASHLLQIRRLLPLAPSLICVRPVSAAYNGRRSKDLLPISTLVLPLIDHCPIDATPRFCVYEVLTRQLNVFALAAGGRLLLALCNQLNDWERFDD